MQLTNGRPQVKSRSKQKSDHRYPVQAEVAYVAKRGSRIVAKGCGQAVQLSGTELVLECANRLASGMDIELTLAWPGPIGMLGGLTLHIEGKTSVSHGNRCTVKIMQYDFETPAERAAKPASSTSGLRLPHMTPLAS